MTQSERGVVSVTDIAAGSKSAQPAVVLTTEERTWVLRRPDGPSFGIDDELAGLAGRTVQVVGHAGPGVFLLTEPVTVLD